MNKAGQFKNYGILNLINKQFFNFICMLKFDLNKLLFFIKFQLKTI